MRAALINEIRDIRVEDVKPPTPADNEVLLKVQMAGLCGSDNSIYTGKMPASLPIIPGHEATGRIEAVGSAVVDFKVGQRVTVHPNYFCQHCLPCKKGLTNICLSKTRLGIDINGVFAEYVAVPEAALYAVPDTLTDEVAVFTEPLAVAVHGVNIASPSRDDRVLIFGAGVIGQLTLQLAKLKSQDITACDLVEERLELARKMGAREIIGKGDSLDDRDASFDIIYETSGAPAALDLAIMLAAQGGRIVLLGLPGESHPVHTTQIVRKELQIYGSMIYTKEFTQSLELLEKGLVQTDPLISGIIDLEKLGESLDRFNDPDRMKTLVRVSP